MWLPWFITNKVIASVDSAEDKLKRPANFIEIFVEMKRLYTIPIKTVFEIAAVMTSIAREDWIRTNDTGSLWTTRK